MMRDSGRGAASSGDGDESELWHAIASPVLTAVAAVGFGVGLVIMLWNYAATRGSRVFVERPETMAWIVVLAFSVAFWAVGSIPLWLDVWKHRGVPRGRERIMLALGTMGFLALVLMPAIAGARLRPTDVPLWHSRARLATLQVLAGALVAMPGVLSIWIRSLEFSRLDYPPPRASAGGPHVSAVEVYWEDRDALLRAGTILGATVGLATLATGALRNALGAANLAAISAALVLAYGAGYTAVLAIVYVPAYITMQRAGRRIRDARTPMKLPGEPGFDEYKNRQAAWDEMLKLKIGPSDSLKVGTAVLAPIVTGLISVLVGVTIS